jgi:hypothetical protein
MTTAKFFLIGLMTTCVLLQAGCATQPVQQTEPQAGVVREGEGRLDYRAPVAGRVWVFDVEESRLIWSGPISAGGQLSLVPGMNVLSINDNELVRSGIRTDTPHRIFFQPRQGA